MHALIIEDESLVALSIEQILTDCGFTSFDIASSSDEAIKAAELRCPDLITADVELKPGSGIDAVNAICSGPPIPVVFITGSPTEAASRMPQHPLVVKPFARGAVIMAVNLAMTTFDKDQITTATHISSVSSGFAQRASGSEKG